MLIFEGPRLPMVHFEPVIVFLFIGLDAKAIASGGINRLLEIPLGQPRCKFALKAICSSLLPIFEEYDKGREKTVVSYPLGFPNLQLQSHSFSTFIELERFQKAESGSL